MGMAKSLGDPIEKIMETEETKSEVKTVSYSVNQVLKNMLRSFA